MYFFITVKLLWNNKQKLPQQIFHAVELHDQFRLVGRSVEAASHHCRTTNFFFINSYKELTNIIDFKIVLPNARRLSEFLPHATTSPSVSSKIVHSRPQTIFSTFLLITFDSIRHGLVLQGFFFIKVIRSNENLRKVFFWTKSKCTRFTCSPWINIILWIESNNMTRTTCNTCYSNAI